MNTIFTELNTFAELPLPSLDCETDRTHNWNPEIPSEICFFKEKKNELQELIEDMVAGIETENKYIMFGKSAFKKYSDYRNRRLSISV